MGLDCVSNCGCSCCTDNFCPRVILSIPFRSFAFVSKSVTVRSYGVPPLIGDRHVEYRIVRIVGLYKDWTGLYSLLVPFILPLNVLTGLLRIVGGFRIALGLLGS